MTDSSPLTDQDLYLFNEGSHLRLYDKLGVHLDTVDGVDGAWVAVWAPNAAAVGFLSDSTTWDADQAYWLSARGDSGIWEDFVPGVSHADAYKFVIGQQDGQQVLRADPFAAHSETPPSTASKVWDLSYDWQDAEWRASRGERQRQESPISIYELHLGSWQRGEDGERLLTYREIVPHLVEHMRRLNFTHVELLPVMEHPFTGSWGYQTTGYFAPTSRFGTPQDFMHFVDELHRAGLGVILDWVPSHFPEDAWALKSFDGTHLFEHADPRQGFHPDWKSAIFNYGRHEVRSFLLSSALSWLDRYHIDGIRVDAVASMLYLDYSREEGEWIPNSYGGNENLEAISFLRRLNEEVYGGYPDVQTYAEESTAWPGVSRPTYTGGLGFGFKWDMGWMHDSLEYLSHDPIHRRYHHNQLTFRGVYMDSENYTLPLSHDEVVHGKGSLLDKMPGDDWQQRANLRLLFGHQFCQPGKKLLFMGGELGVRRDWQHDGQINWALLDDERHAGIMRWVGDIAGVYRDRPALHAWDCEPGRGFEWVAADDSDQSVVSYLRHGPDDSMVLVVCNFTPVPRHGYRVGVPVGGYWRELLNSDAEDYGGSGVGNMGGRDAEHDGVHGHEWALSLSLPPLSIVVLEPHRESPPDPEGLDTTDEDHGADEAGGQPQDHGLPEDGPAALADADPDDGSVKAEPGGDDGEARAADGVGEAGGAGVAGGVGEAGGAGDGGAGDGGEAWSTDGAIDGGATAEGSPDPDVEESAGWVHRGRPSAPSPSALPVPDDRLSPPVPPAAPPPSGQTDGPAVGPRGSVSRRPLSELPPPSTDTMSVVPPPPPSMDADISATGLADDEPPPPPLPPPTPTAVDEESSEAADGADTRVRRDAGGWGRTDLGQDEVAVVEESGDSGLAVVESGADATDGSSQSLPSRVEIQAAARADDHEPPSLLDRIRGMFN